MFYIVCLFFFFKQKTAYEMRISDWSSDVCSSDLGDERLVRLGERGFLAVEQRIVPRDDRRLVGAAAPERGDVEPGAHVPQRGGCRSEERRVGKGWVSPCRSRWAPYH